MWIFPILNKHYLYQLLLLLNVEKFYSTVEREETILVGWFSDTLMNFILSVSYFPVRTGLRLGLEGWAL